MSVNILAIRQLSVNPIQTLCKQIHPEVMLKGIFLVLQFGAAKATPPSFVEHDATTAEKAILRLLLRIFARETCFYSKVK